MISQASFMELVPEWVEARSMAKGGNPQAVPGSKLIEEISRTDASLVSFDIFDTLLTRNVGEPAAVFHEIGLEIARRGLVDCSPLVFVQVRYANEQRARTNKDVREISLREIYEEVAQVLNCSDKIDELMAVEIEAEDNALRLIPQSKKAVNLARSRFGRVIFISDMYLPKSFIEAQLVKTGLFEPGDHLYLSSDVGVQKGDGRLFRHVLKNEKLEPGQLLHCGDSLRYDIKPAQKLGIRTFHCQFALANASENAMNRRASWNAGFGPQLAGASRLARLACPESDSDKRTMWDTGASVTGPFVLLYAQWILERAAQLGITQLYFLARDAYFPFLAVQSLLSRNPGSTVVARYIYGSRPTYLALGVETLGDDEWNTLTIHGGEPCRAIKDLAAALMTSSETILEFIKPLGFGVQDIARDLTPQEIERIREHALGDPGFNQALLRDLEKSQDLTRRYLEAEGFDPAKGTALIDTGWTTRSHAPFFDFLGKLGCQNLKLFYVGIMVDQTHVPLDSIEAFVFDFARRRGAMRRDIYYARPCEALLFANHGRTVAFRETDEGIVPVLDEVENPKSITRFFGTYSGGIQAFLDHALLEIDHTQPRLGLANLAEQVISRFWCEPTVAEARVWAKMDWQWDPQGRVTYPFARSYGLRDVWKAAQQGRYPECYPQFWVAGAVALTPPKLLLLIKVAGGLSRRLKGSLKRLPSPVFQNVRGLLRALKLTRSQRMHGLMACMIDKVSPYV